MVLSGGLKFTASQAPSRCFAPRVSIFGFDGSPGLSTGFSLKLKEVRFSKFVLTKNKNKKIRVFFVDFKLAPKKCV